LNVREEVVKKVVKEVGEEGGEEGRGDRGEEGESYPDGQVLQDQGGLRLPPLLQLQNHQGNRTRRLRRRLQGTSPHTQAININSTNEQEYAIKINFNTVSRELIYAEMAFLLLVKNRENLPKLVNLFVHHDITHIVLEYFKFKPFIVLPPTRRPSSTPSPSRKSNTTSWNY
jgi:hypothetical protein